MAKLFLKLLIPFFFSIQLFGQELDGFKYVHIPSLQYKNGGIDNWNISGMLRKWFSNKGFVVLTESSSQPDELKKDPCLMLTCEINHTNVTYGTNRVTINLKNCDQKTVYSKTGGAMGLSVQDDFNMATKRAFEGIRSMKYNFNPDKTYSKEFEKSLPTLEMTGYTEEYLKRYFNDNPIDPIEGIYKSYQTDGMSYYKIGIIKSNEKYKAVIIESEYSYWRPGELKAVFEPSSMKGFYSVKWYMGNKIPFETFGKMDNAAVLSIEFKDQITGEKRQDNFIKMFPVLSGNISTDKDYSKASGSGFFISPNGIIATNAHVIEDATKIEVTVSNESGNSTYKTKVVLLDSKNDVALLQIEDDSFKELNSIPYGIVENSEVGSKVFTIGYPLNSIMGTNYKVTDGIISSTSGIADDVRYYQISVPIQPGNSGGPLFNKDGNVIGITSARLNGQAIGTQVENVNYAIKSSYLLNLYNMLPHATKIPITSQISSKELQDQVKILKDFVCLIKVF